ncbi:hypothetical protein FLL45_12685 [Aliikangiella marina]|uniref:Histidine kinase n=1 Tax=Aliikangiella marina TaxID=1712262 RepID=A0A545T924_9GAMM|nr:FIST N-terminal domain-containing protein [Aliikangiella marina]TQV73720.1 hypothetical protein FLL45_12685 [Aliikangiella marina]
MNVKQFHFHDGEWFPTLPQSNSAQLLLVFGCRHAYRKQTDSETLRKAFPRADIIGCTTSGEILGTEVYDDSLVVSAIEFEQTKVEVISANVREFQRSFDAGITLANGLLKDGLRYALVISDGQLVNGTELVAGISQGLPEKTLITGGMAGDAEKFQETVVWHNETVAPGEIVLCGFYGDSLKVGHGTLGGWSSFGPNRFVTRSEGNVLFELDEQPALDLYKKYLGEFSDQLPSSALRFPLSLKLPGDDEAVVRTILSINEDDKSMVFAGDIPQGATCKLMKASFDSLVDGANGAAEGAVTSIQSDHVSFALLISCVGRRLVLGQRVFEELESVEDVLSEDCPLSGFYSYGEISPLLNGTQCRLHNQTMTITTLSEVIDA